MRTSYSHSQILAPDVQTFYFAKPSGLRYQAGQFSELTLPSGERHWFTLSSSPAEGQLAITTKVRRSGASSYKRGLQSLAPGDTVELSEPMGDFVLPKNRAIPLIFVAGGIGISPVRSIVCELLGSSEPRDIAILYATDKHMVFRDILEQSRLPVEYFTTQRISVDDILASQPPDGTLFYIAGPEAMVNALQADLLARGIDFASIITDAFLGYT